MGNLVVVLWHWHCSWFIFVLIRSTFWMNCRMLLKIRKYKWHKYCFVATSRYRLPMQVKDLFVFCNGEAYPCCPRCNNALEREYMNYCSCCGQCLDWGAADSLVAISVSGALWINWQNHWRWICNIFFHWFIKKRFSVAEGKLQRKFFV